MSLINPYKSDSQTRNKVTIFRLKYCLLRDTLQRQASEVPEAVNTEKAFHIELKNTHGSEKRSGDYWFLQFCFYSSRSGFPIVWGCFSVFMWIKGLDRVTELCLNTLTTLKQK